MLGGGGGDGGELAKVAGFSAQLNPAAALLATQLVGTSSGGGLHKHRRQQRQNVEDEAQWIRQQRGDRIVPRAEMERNTTAAPPPTSEAIWEAAAAARIRDRGHRRTPEQCRTTLNSLVDRYKGKAGTAEPEIDGQFLLFEELQEETTTKRCLQISEDGERRAKRKLKRLIGDGSSNEFSVDGSAGGEEVNEEHQLKMRKKKADARRTHPQQRANVTGNSIQELVRSFLQQQEQVELQWKETMERRARERRSYEWEWRQTMEKLERERLTLEQAWRTTEEQRRMREESRADRRDALLTALLSKLIEDDDDV